MSDFLYFCTYKACIEATATNKRTLNTLKVAFWKAYRKRISSFLLFKGKSTDYQL